MSGGHLLSIYVAQISGDDTANSARNDIIDSISAQFYPDTVEILPTSIHIDFYKNADFENNAKIPAEAGAFLTKYNGDILVIGRLDVKDGKTLAILRLFSKHVNYSGADIRLPFDDRHMIDAELLEINIIESIVLYATNNLLELPKHYMGTELYKEALHYVEIVSPFIDNPPETGGEHLAGVLIDIGLISERLGFDSSSEYPTNVDMLKKAYSAFLAATKQLESIENSKKVVYSMMDTAGVLIDLFIATHDRAYLKTAEEILNHTKSIIDKQSFTQVMLFEESMCMLFENKSLTFNTTGKDGDISVNPDSLELIAAMSHCERAISAFDGHDKPAVIEIISNFFLDVSIVRERIEKRSAFIKSIQDRQIEDTPSSNGK